RSAAPSSSTRGRRSPGPEPDFWPSLFEHPGREAPLVPREVSMADARALTYRVLLAQSGDREALDALLRDVQGPLYGYLVGLVGHGHLAEDILQDVFVLICRKLAWLRVPEVFRPWAYRIASREAFRRLRSVRRRTQLLGPEPADEAPAPGESTESFPEEWIER